MKRIIFLLILIALPCSAQEAENGASISAVCRDATSYMIEVSVWGAVDTVYIVPDKSDAIEWQDPSPSKRFAIPLENESLSLVIYAEGGAFNGDTIVLEPTGACNTEQATEDIRPMVIERLKAMFAEWNRL